MAVGLLTIGSSVYIGVGICKSGIKLYSALSTKKNIKLAETEMNRIITRTEDMTVRAAAYKNMKRTIEDVKEVSLDQEFTQEVLYGNGIRAFTKNTLAWWIPNGALEKTKEFAYKYILA